MKLPPKKTIIATGATLLILGTAYTLWPGEKQAAPATVPKPKAEANLLRFPVGAPQLAQLRIETAEVAPVPLTEPLAARIAYNEDTTVRFFAPVAGRVTQIHVQIGDTVKPGQALMTLDAPDLGAALADQAKAKAESTQKQSALHRARTLFEGEAISRRELETAESEASQALAEAQRANLRVSNFTRGVAVNGQSLVLRSPISGVVSERSATPGLEVRPEADKALLVVANLRQLRVTIDLPEKDLDKIAIGQRLKIEANAYQDRSFDGQVERISPVVDPATRRIQVRSTVDNEDGALKPEMYVRVHLLADSHHEAVRIPISALLIEGLKNHVFIEKEPGALEKREIEVDLQTREFAYVSKGVTGGERIVSAGALLLNAELASSAAGR